MNKPFALLFLLAGSLLAGLAGVQAQEAKTKETAAKSSLHATLSEKPGGPPAASFGADQPQVYLNYTGDSLKKGEKIRAVWTLEDSGKSGTKNRKILDSAQEAVGPNSKGSFFQLSKPVAGWPLGKYRVDVYDREAKVQTLQFTIK